MIEANYTKLNLDTLKYNNTFKVVQFHKYKSTNIIKSILTLCSNIHMHILNIYRLEHTFLFI